MKYKNISIFVFIGAFAIIILQILWLYNTYVALENNLYKESNSILIKAIRREISIRFKKAPKGTEIVGVSIPADAKKNDLAPEIVSLNEGLSNIGLEMSLSKVDSIAYNMLNDIDLPCSISVNKIRISDNKVLSSSNPNPSVLPWREIKSEIINITADSSQGVQLVILNPYKFLFGKINLLIIITIIVLSFIIACIILQIKIISRLQVILHDMKTPLSTIMMVQDMLKSGRLEGKPEIKNKYMSIAESETEHLFALTNKILTISKLENHKLEMNKTEVELTPIIEKLTEKFKAKAQKPVNFIISLQAKTAYADNDYLGEVISNLIDNAIKYSKESVEINITAEESERYTILKVRDNGLGISETDQRIIFQKYERAAAARRSRRNGASGFGLGLNFVDQVIKAHEGRIFVNSTEGEFTEFTIYLPLETPNNRHNR